MKLMAGNVKIASYRKYEGRWFHEADTQHRGPSVSNRAFHQGQRPAPLRTTQAPTPRPQTPEEKLRTMSDAERRRIALKALTVGVPKVPSVLDEVVQRQREQGKIV